MLRQMINDDLFKLYDSDLLLRLRNAKNLSDTRKTLARFKDYLGEFPPSPELAKSFLAQFVDRKPRTLYRYAQMIKMFMKWYGEPLSDFKVRIPKSLPPYTEDSDIERLFKAIENKKTHKKNIVRDTLLIELALKSGMRRGELANLKVSDIHDDFLVVKEGKNGKDRIIPLSQPIVLRLKSFIKGKKPSSSVFDLKPPTITMKIKAFARKAGLENVHAHTLRHKFATNLLEQGANIRSVQHLLGHENLSTTQVYLDITDKSIREAINLLEKNNNIIDDRENKSIFQDKTNQPLLMIRAVDKPDEIDQTKVMIGGYFSHFEIWNEGQRSASEIVILLMGSDRKNWLESKQIDVIRPNESISFMPNLRARPEGNYYILCQYKHISHRANEANLNQTWLPFKVKYASKINEVYVKPNEMELKPNVSIENIIFI